MSNMAASVVKFRCERLHWFLRLFNESGRSVSHVFATRSNFSTAARNLYSKTLPVLGKKWDTVGSTPRDFAKPQAFTRDDLKASSRTENRNFIRDKEDSESDSESEDEESVNSKSHKLEQKSDKAAQFARSKLIQKSGTATTLRPSKYLFKDRGGWHEEQQWVGREIPEDSKSKAGWYARQMTRLIRGDKIDEALEVMSSMKEDKIPLTVQIYNIIISGYARVGKVRKAFKSYNDVKKRGLSPTPHTYTSLFNACTKSPAPQHALENVEKLLAEINTRIKTKKDLEMNVITYNAAIRAVNVCGDPLRAFEIYKDMKYNNIEPDGHTFSSLLVACSFDKVDGPSTAFELLEEMKTLKIKPDIYIYNSVLKVMRDFKVFNQEQNPELSKPVSNSGKTVTEKVERYVGKEDQEHAHDGNLSENNTGRANASCNSLQYNNNDTKQSDKGLKLHSYFPGVEAFIQMMAIEDVYPDVRTFQLLLYLTSSKAEEQYLMELMKGCGVSPDVTFYNTLVKRNAVEGDLLKAKEHMRKLEETLQVSPSEKSYQTLARGCTNQDEGLALLGEMQSEGITPGQSVYGTLIAGAARRKQFTYLVQLVKRMTSDGIRPNERIMAVLERTYKLPCKKPFIEENTHRRLVKVKRFRHVEQKGFQTFFENWKEKVLNKGTASDDKIQDGFIDEEESKFTHL